MRTKNILILVLIILLGLTGYSLLQKNGTGSNQTNVLFSLSGAQSGSESEPGRQDVPALTETYVHPAHHFSFDYPQGFTITTTSDELGEIVTIQNSSAEGFQIVIQPIEEDIRDISPELIREQIPGIVMNETQEVILGSSGKGTAFLSDNPAFNAKSREVWFAHNKVVYQISTYSKFDPLLKAILSTWEFR